MAQNQDSTKEPRLEEWSLVEFKKQWEVVKTRVHSSRRAFQKRVKPITRNWEKFYLHRRGKIQRKENHQHRCHHWNCICNDCLQSQRQNREPHQETAGSPKRTSTLKDFLKGLPKELSSPLFHILDLELMGLKLKTKQTKNTSH